MEYDPRIKLNVFDSGTTYKTDYRKYTDLDKRELYRWPQERSERPEKPNKLYKPTDHENFIEWKRGAHIPNTLFVDKKPIVNTKPTDKYKDYGPFVDKGKEEAIRTRPRRYISPAIGMDDIPDPEMRQTLCEFMYTTDWKKASEEAAGKMNKMSIPDFTLEPKADQVTLVPEFEDPIAPGCREIAKRWDVGQRRALVEPTKTFWLHKDPPVKCGACENPYHGLVPQEMREEIACLIENDKLRLIHDVPCSSYAGYKPRLACVHPSKVDLPVTHPFLSTSQAITQRYAADIMKKKQESQEL